MSWNMCGKPQEEMGSYGSLLCYTSGRLLSLPRPVTRAVDADSCVIHIARQILSAMRWPAILARHHRIIHLLTDACGREIIPETCL
jgi:hypothetical protein